jgi:dUTP pyrophosphatase
MEILLRRRNLSAQHPFKKYPLDAGMDLVCIESLVVWPFQVKDIDTGWDIKVPDGYWGSIKTRSSTFYRKGLLVLEGVIDPDYTGPLSVVILNPTFIPKIILAGERLAQLLLCPIHYCDIVETQQLPHTLRGQGGFGHTGF